MVISKTQDIEFASVEISEAGRKEVSVASGLDVQLSVTRLLEFLEEILVASVSKDGSWDQLSGKEWGLLELAPDMKGQISILWGLVLESPVALGGSGLEADWRTRDSGEEGGHVLYAEVASGVRSRGALVKGRLARTHTLHMGWGARLSPYPYMTQVQKEFLKEPWYWGKVTCRRGIPSSGPWYCFSLPG